MAWEPSVKQLVRSTGLKLSNLLNKSFLFCSNINLIYGPQSLPCFVLDFLLWQSLSLLCRSAHLFYLQTSSCPPEFLQPADCGTWFKVLIYFHSLVYLPISFSFSKKFANHFLLFEVCFLVFALFLPKTALFTGNQIKEFFQHLVMSTKM